MSIICLTTCDSIIEANFIKNNLENEDIQCFLANEISSTLLPGYSGMLNAGVKVMIEEADFERANALLDKSGEEKQVACPNCNSTNIKFGFGEGRAKKIFTVILSSLITVPFGNIKARYVCKDCKTEF